MDPDRRGIDGQGQEATNVVRFPRDWLGPRDALVPIGAGHEDKAASSSSVVADDFWSEDAASLHELVVAPMPAPVLRAVTPGDTGQLRAAPSEPDSSKRTAPAKRRHPSLRPLRRRGLVALAAAAGVLITLAVGVIRLGPVPTPTPRLAARSEQGAFGAGQLERLVEAGAAAAARTGARSAVGSPPMRTHRHRAAPHSVRRRSVTSTPTQAAEVSYQGQPAAPATPPGTGYIVSGSTGAATARTPSASAGPSASHSGPVGPGAPFGPGQMGSSSG